MTDDPYKDFDAAREELKKLHENPDNLPIHEWMAKWRELRSRVQRAAYIIKKQTEDLA